MLRKSLASGIRDVDTLQGIVTGYAAAFNIIDDDQDIIIPGAFAKTLAEQGPLSKQPRIKMLYQHDATKLLGVPSVLREDPYGLYFEVTLADTSLARDVLALYSEKIITEHSIGYEVVEATWDRTKGARLLQQLRLFEFSCVTWGANSQTPVISVKSLSQPSDLTAIATRAQRLDTLLHNGTLRSDALCATLDRELKSLHAALAPAHDVSQPYTIQGVIDSMTILADKLATKGASEDDKKAQEARAKKYAIGIKEGGNVTKPGKYADLSDDDFADPTNYSYPIDTKPHADNAAARFGDPDNRSEYTKDEQAIIDKRIASAQKKFGEDKEDGAKEATMSKRQVKGTSGDITVAEDGTHDPYTGTHEHSHKAMGSQGDDDMHEHAHEHKGDATHDHEHAKASTPKAAPRAHTIKTPDGRTVRKARDFDTLFQSLNAADELQDDWGDTFIAFTHAMNELMWQASAVTNGWSSEEDAKGFDAMEAAQANINAFGKAVISLVQRSVDADFCPMLDNDGDQFLDPDGCNADDDDDDDCVTIDFSKSRRNPLAPKAMPDAPSPLKKAGRSISEGNRKTITEALDGMSEAMKAMKGHHGTIADLMMKTDPDHTRQDEDNALGDDDTENGGTNINKSRYTPRRTAEQAGTTHQGLDFSDIDSDLDALRSRKGGKAQ